MSSKKILVVFTGESVEMLIAQGGSHGWALNVANARKCELLVCCRNRYQKGASQAQEHGAAFFVAAISKIEPTGEPGRSIVRFDRYALIDKPPIAWPGSRNPVWYAPDLSAVKLYPGSALKWQDVQSAAAEVPAPPALPAGLSIAEAKAGVALRARVRPDQVEITIRG